MKQIKDEKKELVWVPARFKKEFEAIDDEGKKEYLILQYIQEAKNDLKYSIESLDDDVASFKGSMIKVRKAFEEAKNEQLTANYELWEKFDKELPSVTRKIDILNDKLTPLIKNFGIIEEKIGKIRTWEIDKLLELVEKLDSYLSYNNDTSKILKFLFENYPAKS